MTERPIFFFAGLIFLIISFLISGFSILKNLSSNMDPNQSKDKYMLIKGIVFIIISIFVSIYTVSFILSYSIDFLLVILVLIAIFAYYLCQKIF